MKVDQTRKHMIGLAGEFLVAGELLRRGFMAAVTYGNAKKADVIVVAEGRAITVEVKTTSGSKWVLGNVVPEASANIWILVHLPDDATRSPVYFVFSSKELRDIVVPIDAEYREKFLKKHGKPFVGKGVSSIDRSVIPDQYAGAWHTLARMLGERQQ